MTFLSILEAILIGPLKLIYELIFVASDRYFDNAGAAIIALSLIVNILVLPLYRRADAIQQAARDTEASLRKGVTHIKKTFSGDEKMMLLQTYYRQNNYKPTDGLKGSMSLLLEIPFFISAYRFLSEEQALVGFSFGPIRDLGAPDGMLTIGSVSINLLPIIMTLLNIISGIVYTKGFPLKDKIQTYGLAAVFLVLLYNSPSGLAFYWTLNNLFSLGKNVFLSVKDSKTSAVVLKTAAVTAYVGCVAYAIATTHIDDFGEKLPPIIVVGAVILAVLCFPLIKKLIKPADTEETNSLGKFMACGAFLTVLIGALIPSALIAGSPQEYVFALSDFSPLWYIVYSLCLAAGTFLIWVPVFYGLAPKNGKVFLDKAALVVCVMAAVNYLFFGTGLGIMSADLVYEFTPEFSLLDISLNIIALVSVAIIILVIAKQWKNASVAIVTAAAVAAGGMSVVNTAGAASSLAKVSEGGELESLSKFKLSREGNNVVVIVLDRAMGAYAPYIFNERPELKEKFSGFTYYSNVISYGGYTNMAMPAAVGGYEYTPQRMNERGDEPLMDKHNEALLVMPVIFGENGYNVSVCDPSYANYQWIPDLTLYESYPYINAFRAEGKMNILDNIDAYIDIRKHSFFLHSFMKTLPLAVQPYLYDNGEYLRSVGTESYTSEQRRFLDCFTVLEHMADMTEISDSADNNFFFMFNNSTHEPATLKEPEYAVFPDFDNTEYDKAHTDRFVLGDEKLKNMGSVNSLKHYQANMAAYIQLAEWFDYLRENGVYDNTRIIIVADHGRNLGNLDRLTVAEDYTVSLEAFFPLFMVKDFGATGAVTYSNEFMTNADVPYTALNGLIENPVNPFTGKPITNDAKQGPQTVIVSEEWSTSSNNGNRFNPSYWVTVEGDMKDINSWTATGRYE